MRNHAPEGRLLEVVPFPGTTLGDWQGKTRLSPQVPYGLTTQDIADKGGLAAMAKWDFELMGQRLMDDERCAGSGLAAYFVKGALDSGIPLETGVNALELIAEVKVRVVEWVGPDRVDFTYKLVGDPVEGSGSYLAAPIGNGQTAMTLKVRIVGSGPLAPMWEAMCGPVLPKFARSFAEQLKERIEESNGVSEQAGSETSSAPTPGLTARLIAWLRALFGRP